MQPLSKLKQFLGYPLESADRKQIEQSLCGYLHHTGRIICTFILVSQVLMFLSMMLKPGGAFANPRRQAYSALYIALFCVTLLAMAFDRYYYREQARKPSLYLGATVLYAAFVCLWSCLVTLVDQLGSNGLNVFCYMLLSVAVFAVLKPWQSILIFSGSFLFLNLFLPAFQSGYHNVFSNVTNTFFIAVLSGALSAFLYRNRLFGYADKIVIRRQYEEIVKINERLNRQVMTDELTQMNNRRFLEEVVQKRLKMEWSREKSVAGIMIDIDFFKQYNDSYGHQAGDLCLQQVAEVITASLAREDAHAVRYGGEEFFLCLFGRSGEQALAIAGTLRQAVESSRFERGENEVGFVTISIGVYRSEPKQAISLDEFVRRCDKALYQAKRGGRNCVASYTQ